MFNYYATKRTVKNGTPQTPANYSYTERLEAERQYHLLCAAACQNADGNDLCAIEMGTIEHGTIERRFYDFRQPEAAEEPEET